MGNACRTSRTVRAKPELQKASSFTHDDPNRALLETSGGPGTDTVTQPRDAAAAAPIDPVNAAPAKKEPKRVGIVEASEDDRAGAKSGAGGGGEDSEVDGRRVQPGSGGSPGANDAAGGRHPRRLTLREDIEAQEKLKKAFEQYDRVDAENGAGRAGTTSTLGPDKYVGRDTRSGTVESGDVGSRRAESSRRSSRHVTLADLRSGSRRDSHVSDNDVLALMAKRGDKEASTLARAADGGGTDPLGRSEERRPSEDLLKRVKERRKTMQQVDVFDPEMELERAEELYEASERLIRSRSQHQENQRKVQHLTAGA